MSKIHIKFSNPELELDGKTTIMVVEATLLFNNKMKIRNKIFRKQITLKDGDKYDLNKAKQYLQVLIEQEAYLWAKNVVDKIIKEQQEMLKPFIAFSEKALHIIEHDDNYIHNLTI